MQRELGQERPKMARGDSTSRNTQRLAKDTCSVDITKQRNKHHLQSNEHNRHPTIGLFCAISPFINYFTSSIPRL